MRRTSRCHYASATLSRALMASTGHPRLIMIYATAYGVIHLKSVEGRRTRREAARAGEISRDCGGTGTRRIALVWTCPATTRIASEGGHTDLVAAWRGPIELLRFSEAESTRTTSRALMVPAREHLPIPARTSPISRPSWLSEQICGGDHAAAVSEAALA